MNWILRLYKEDDSLIEEIEIDNRTERQAEKVSQYYIRSCDEEVYDWSLTEDVNSEEQ